MFDGMPDQFYQFLAAAAATSRATTVTPTSTADNTASLPLSFSLHHGCTTFPTNFQPPVQQPNFDVSYLLHHPQVLPLHLQQPPNTRNDQAKQDTVPLNVLHATTLQEGSLRSSLMMPEPWSNEEVLALLRVRSSMDNSWFPADFTWENVSRKLAEVGFKRSAEKCKEKFEEETRSFNSSIISNCSNKNISNNYRLFGELEELYNSNSDNCNDNVSNNNHGNDDDHHHSPPHDNQPDNHDQSLSQRNQSPSRHDDEEEDEQVQEENDTIGQEKVGNDGNKDTRNDINNNNVEEDDQQSVDDSEKTEENTKKVIRKRKRQKKFEMFKGFCEKIVSKMMAQQEELHCKILQDMVQRDEDKIAREEAWKKQEIERITKEFETRAHEQTIVGDRQAKILNFLKKFTSSETVESHQSIGETLGNLVIKVPNTSALSTSSILSQDSISAQTTSSSDTHDQNLTSLVTKSWSNIPTSAPLSPNRLVSSKLTPPMSSRNPNTVTSANGSTRLASISTLKSSGCDHTNTNATDQVMDFKSRDSQTEPKLIAENLRDDTGRRWPRDEVLALINIRCSLFNHNGDPLNDRENFAKGPLWERISHKMLELGYKRSAKRCKEKWENINKYFRKTKDLNKKRSIDSRTCPYFHQLNHLYSQGAIHGPSDRSESLVGSPENQSTAISGAQGGSGSANGISTIHASQGNEGTVVQAPGFGFEF